MDSLTRTLRHALRSLARTPGFTITVVLTLALGIGANSAVFSAIDSILVRPLPYVEPDRLVSVMETRPEAGETVIAPVRLEEWNAGNSSFEAITGYFTEDVSETTGDTPTRVRWAGVAPNFLAVWRVAPLLGRDFVAEESATQRPNVVMISERLWRNRFNADPRILERTIRLGDPGFSFQIVGVLPTSFLFADRDVDVWFPNFTNYALARQRGWGTYEGVGRLRPGVTLEAARADMNLVQARLGEEFDFDRDRGVSLRPLKDAVVGEVRGSLWLVFGAVSLLLLIACANIASLLLARAAQRVHEVAVRRSLGASAAAIGGQMLAEAGVLAFAGAGAGLLVAAGAAGLFRALAPDLPRLDDIALDGRILIYTTASAVIVALLCGLVPAVRSARGGDSLAGAGRAQVSGRHGMQWTLVGVQVALSVTLLAGAGLLLRSFEILSRVDPGFEPSRVLAFRVSGSNFEFVNSDVPARVERTRTGLESLPGVEAVAVSAMLPGVTGFNQVELALAGASADASPLVADSRANVSPSYFETVGIPLVAGELCRESGNGVDYAMVNQSFASRYFPDRSVIGVELANNPLRRIVGVVADAREAGIAREPIPTVYRCSFTGDATPWYLVRTSGPPAAAVASVRAKVRELEPARTVYELAPLEDHIGDAHAESRLRTMLLTAFATTALGLTCLGVYGTLSYVVGLRRREVGLRVALGAMSRNIVAQFLARALRIVAVACAAGLALSFLFTRFLSEMLYGVSLSDPITLAAVVAVVVGAAVLAAIVPATSAARIDPMQALREE